MTKINVWPIVKAHFSSLKDRDGIKYSVSDIAGFYGIPLFISSLLAVMGFQVAEKYINTLIIAQTIFVPLLVNVLVIIYGLIDTIKKRQTSYVDDVGARVARDQKKLRLLRQLYGNISYTVLVSGLCLAVLALYSVQISPRWLILIDRCLVYFLTIHLILTSMMIIKRFFILMESEFE